MFWIVTALAGFMAFSVSLGQVFVWFAILKWVLFVAVVLILVMGIALLRRNRQ